MAQTTVYNAESHIIETKFEGIVAFKLPELESRRKVAEIVGKVHPPEVKRSRRQVCPWGSDRGSDM